MECPGSLACSDNLFMDILIFLFGCSNIVLYKVVSLNVIVILNETKTAVIVDKCTGVEHDWVRIFKILCLKMKLNILKFKGHIVQISIYTNFGRVYGQNHRRYQNIVEMFL